MAIVPRFLVGAAFSSSSKTTNPLCLRTRSSPSSQVFDVFLSFRGADTRKNFTDHLYRALKQAGIHTFRDDDEIERGKLLKPELEKAITHSSVSVIVFSRNYSTSRWCLDELLTILEERNRPSSRHQVLPIFYNVDPTDVRNQSGSFAEAFYEHYDQVEAETDQETKKEKLMKVNAWKAALTEAANLTGMVLADGQEADFIDKIVKMIIKKIRRDALGVEKYLVGINDTMDWIDSWMQNGATDVLVLYGIGGIGKTTIAKRVYNSNFQKFEGSCFLAEIREAFSQSNEVLRLQKQLVSTILRTLQEEIIWNVHEGASKVKDALVDREVLIVLDDVSDVKQLEVLFGTSQTYPGSKILITTRHRELLHALEGHCESLAIRKLDDNQSMELFSWHAFGQDEPKESYKEKAEVIVRRCVGLPLALKLLGSSLRGRDIAVWEDSVRKLEEIPNSDIQRTLKISYDCLEDDKDKDLFLHIAFFFAGGNKDDVVRILEHCGLYPVVGIHNLIDRCLLDVEDTKLMMHQLLQEMGREIVRQESLQEPGKRSRLWRNEDSFDVLKNKTGTEKIVGLSLQMNMLIKEKSIQGTINMDDIKGRWYMNFLGRLNITNSITSEGDLEIDSFKRMDNLMLLKLNDIRFSGSYQKFPKQLRWLCLHGFPLKFLPKEMSLDKLVALDLSHSKLRQLWKGRKVLRLLKILNLSYSDMLVQTPNFEGLPSLEKLILRGCVSLVKVCPSIIQLKKLFLLDLQECQSLRNIPTLPTSIVTLRISNTDAIGQGKWWDYLPQYLVNLDIKNCNLSCDSFPREFDRLVSLKCMDMSLNPFTALPDCIQSLPNLEILIVCSCLQLRSLVGLPATLQILDTRDNFLLEEASSLPDSLIDWKYIGSRTLSLVEGCFKSVLVTNVERKIIFHLHLGCASLTMVDVELISRVDIWHGDGIHEAVSRTNPVKVWYEFGIYSISLPCEELPSWYMFKATGSKICFQVPSFPTNPKVKGLNISFICRSEMTLPYHWTSLNIHVYNVNKDLLWVYSPTLASFRTFRKVGGKACFLWSSLWKCGQLLEEGDRVIVAVDIDLTATDEPSKNIECDECSVNLVYNDKIPEGNDIQEEETEISEQKLSWTEKVFVEISDYVHTGKRYFFSSYKMSQCCGSDTEFVDWLGPKSRSRPRLLHGGMIQEVHFAGHQ